MTAEYVIGLDFGTDSVRAVVVNAENGKEAGESVAGYPNWLEGKYCDPAKNQFRQHPADYLEVMTAVIQDVLNKCGPRIAEKVIALGVDTTGSTPCAVDKEGTPLALKEEFSDNPNAMFILWKDHTAIKEAAEINELAHHWGGIDYTRYEGGIYSSEWFWAKILHVLRNDQQVRETAHSWVEHCDWIPAVLSGNTDPLTMKRSRCAAGHKAMWHKDWGGLPAEEFLSELDPLLAGITQRLYTETHTAAEKAGELTPEWAEKLGLKPGISLAVGAFDAHLGAVGGGIKPGSLLKIMGTSTCDILVAPRNVINDKVVRGICGQVDGSVIPGMIGLEAGQSAFGDVYAWYRDLLSWPLTELLVKEEKIEKGTIEEVTGKILNQLTEAAAKLSIDETGLLALDWLNGRRTPFADQTLKGAVVGLQLGTTAPAIFRALVEATAFGSRAIQEQFINEGIHINEVIALGGIAQKSDFVMQITADVLNKKIKVVASAQACALGAAMFGAVAAGKYENVTQAQQAMGSGFSKTFSPRADFVEKYDELYQQYCLLGKELEPFLQNL